MPDVDDLIANLERAVHLFRNTPMPDDHVPAIEEAAHALSATGDPRAVEPLVEALAQLGGNDASDAVLAALRPFGAAVVEPTLDALDDLRPGYHEAFLGGPLIDALTASKVRDPRIWRRILWYLELDAPSAVIHFGIYGDRRGVDVLLDLLESTPVRGNALLLMDVGESLAMLDAVLTDEQQRKLDHARQELRYAHEPN